MCLDATPPAEWGDRFTLRGIFWQSLLSGRAADFAGWTGQLYAEFGRADMSRIRQYASPDSLGVELIQGNGALRGWADVSKGQLTATFLYATPGAEGLRQAVKLLRGEKLEPVITLPTMLITKDNAGDIMKKNGLL